MHRPSHSARFYHPHSSGRDICKDIIQAWLWFILINLTPDLLKLLSRYVWFAHKVYNFSSFCAVWWMVYCDVSEEHTGCIRPDFPLLSHIIDTSVSSQTQPNSPEPDFVTLHTKADSKLSHGLLLF
jgi:hypothetical protein